VVAPRDCPKAPVPAGPGGCRGSISLFLRLRSTPLALARPHLRNHLPTVLDRRSSAEPATLGCRVTIPKAQRPADQKPAKFRLITVGERRLTDVFCKTDSSDWSDGPSESLLHATSMIRTSYFFEAGGFSTDQKIANDTQFMLRAHFKLRMRNVDGFLYIRRRHRDALTVAPETMVGTAIRKKLSRIWFEDFEAVKGGKVRLEETSLRPMAAEARHRFLSI